MTRRIQAVDERCEALIRKAIDLRECMATAKAELNLIEAELDRYFPREDSEEHLVTEFGAAHRVQQEEIHIDPHHVGAVRRALGSEFSRYFSETPYCVPTDECLVLLSSGSSYLGHLLRDNLVIKRQRLYAFTPPPLSRQTLQPNPRA